MTYERLNVSDDQGVKVARFKDHKILDEQNIQQLGEDLSKLVASDDCENLLLNFEDVEFLSSAALGKLISVKKRAQQAGVDLWLCSIRPEIFEVFKITNLDKVFDIADDQTDAISKFK